jgi:hypothetical protein
MGGAEAVATGPRLPALGDDAGAGKTPDLRAGIACTGSPGTFGRTCEGGDGEPAAAAGATGGTAAAGRGADAASDAAAFGLGRGEDTTEGGTAACGGSGTAARLGLESPGNLNPAPTSEDGE